MKITKYIIAFLLILLMAIAYYCRSCVTCNNIPMEEGMRIKSKSGNVNVLWKGEKIHENAEMALPDGSSVITGHDGRIVIDSKGERISLFPNTEILLNSDNKAKNKGAGSGRITLRKGEIYCRSSSDGDVEGRSNITTPFGVVESKKASYVVAGDSDRVTAVVVEGSIQLRTGEKRENTVVVSKDQKATISKGESPVVTTLTQEEKRSLRERIVEQNKGLGSGGPENNGLSRITTVSNKEKRTNGNKVHKRKQETVIGKKQESDKETIVIDKSIVEPILEVPTIR